MSEKEKLRLEKMYHLVCSYILKCLSGRRGRDRMVVGFATTCAINACHH